MNSSFCPPAPFYRRSCFWFVSARSSFFLFCYSKSSSLTLNRHRILVVPSRWPEPFGIVALEAIACGCVVVGSAGGGLSEAIGPCGLTFPNGDGAALAHVLRELLGNPERVAELGTGGASHLARFSPSAVAKRYLEEMGKR
jgi:glycosyltransferase involved in cell wall biosynthesis